MQHMHVTSVIIVYDDTHTHTHTHTPIHTVQGGATSTSAGINETLLILVA